MGAWMCFPGLRSNMERSSQDTSATLVTAVTGPILQPTLSVSLQLFPAPQMVVAACAVSLLPCQSAGRLPALPETLPAADPKPGGRKKAAASAFFFHFACYSSRYRSFKALLELWSSLTGLACWCRAFAGGLCCCLGEKLQLSSSGMLCLDA